MNKTGIEWCDYSLNPFSGCSPVSEGCENCYAAAISKRFHRPWGGPVFHPERMKVKPPKGKRVFVGSVTDMFHEAFDADETLWTQRQALFAFLAEHTETTWILLTKRAERMRQTINDAVPPHIWLGVTVENQRRADERIPILLDIPAKVRFASVEPMLSPMSIFREKSNPLASDEPWPLSWVICGPETGPKARPCEPAWIENLANQCAAVGVPFFDKRKNPIRREWPT